MLAYVVFSFFLQCAPGQSFTDSHGNESICTWLMFDTRHKERISDNCPQIEIDGALLPFFFKRMPHSTLQIIYHQSWFPILSLNSWHGPVSSWYLSMFFSIPIRVQQGEGMTRACQTHPLTCSSQHWLGLAWLTACWLHRGTAASPHCTHTHTHKKQNTLLETTHTHTRLHTEEVCAFVITPVTWNH